MNRGAAPRTARRSLIEIAESERDDDPEFREGIAAQVAVVREWWAERPPSESRFERRGPKRLDTVYDLREFLDDARPEEAAHDHALVVYVTGHGVTRPSHDHFLLLRDSDERRLPATAFQTGDLIARVLDSDSDHILVMVDSCYSGVLRKDLQRRLEALNSARRNLNSLVVISSANETGTPRPQQFTRLLQAVSAYFKEKEAGFANAHLSFAEFFEAMRVLRKRDVSLDVQFLWPNYALISSDDHQDLSPCLPNPGYAPERVVVGPARGAVAWSAADLDAYWLSRASGRPSDGGPGWHFTGRSGLVRRLNRFLTGDASTLVVTGEAGSGKSALLARAVTLSDPGFRADPAYAPLIEDIPPGLLVPVGAVDAAVLARNADADEVAAALYAALTGTVPTGVSGVGVLDDLLDHVLVTARREGRPLTIVIDGIDEAKHPARIVTDLVRRLAHQWTDDELPAVRLLLGVRSARPDTGGDGPRPLVDRSADLLSLLVRSTDAGEPLRTDTDADTVEDIAAYVGALLKARFTTGPGPSAPPAPRAPDRRAPDRRAPDRRAPDPRALERLALAVAEEVTPSFLDARLAAEALLAAPDRLPRPDDADWRRGLRRGTQELLRQDLRAVERATGVPARSAVHVLRATAFAQGEGLPWGEVWPCAVQALARGEVAAPEALVRRVQEGPLQGYLAKGVEDGKYVYRPVHERISEVLRGDPRLLLSGEAEPGTSEEAEAGVRAAHRQLATAFSALHARKTGLPYPYVCRHLVQHAAAGGVLNDRVVTDGFLPHETSGNVRGALGLLAEHAPDTERLFAWARIEPFLADAPPLARADSLRFSLLEGREPAAVRDSGGPAAGRLVPVWNHLAVPGNVLARQDADLCSLVSFTLRDGTPLIAVGDADGAIRVWDPATVTPVGPPIPGHGRFARALTVVSDAEEPSAEVQLAVGCDEGVWICDPLSGSTRQLPVTSAVQAMVSFSDVYGSPRLAIGTARGLVLCDPLTGGPRGGEWAYGDDSLTSVLGLAALALTDGTTLLAVQRAGRVEIVQAAAQGFPTRPVCTVRVDDDEIAALALIGDRTGESPFLALASRTRGTVGLWDALTGAGFGDRTVRRSATVLAPYLRAGSEPLLALGTDDGAVHLWNPETGEEARRFPADHTDGVTGLAVVPGRDGVPLLVSASADRTVRVWNPEAWARHPERFARSVRRADGTLLAVLPGPGDAPETVEVGPDRNLTVRSAATGAVIRLIDLPRTGLDGPVTALAVHAPPGGSPMVFAGLPDGAIGVWSEGRWRMMNAWIFGDDHATAFAAFADSGRTVLAVGTRHGSVVYCDPANGQVLGWLHIGEDTGSVHALTYVPLLSGGVLALASEDGGVRLCRPFSEPHAEWPGDIGTVESLAVLPTYGEGELLLAAGGSDGCVRLWTGDPEREPFTLPTRHDGPVSALHAVRSPGSRRLLVSTGHTDTTVRLWDPAAGEEVTRLVTAAALTSLGVVPSTDSPAPRQPVIVFGGPAGIGAVTPSAARPEG
ncbi:AAA family ATPase [Streptomyces sp. NPDC003300]|uniref:AAA family ATPase n=1 Tax=unclassified Streptomyces TaxID=2593676 RepID=UPI0033B1C103